ncbi:hypothetical protein ACFQZ4_19190 [Catellatospora coxensis]
MTTVVRLLGPPGIARDGLAVAGPRGHKAWGLLAFLALAERPPSRQRLVSMLFERADDPRGALRWNLAEMRRALGGRVAVGRDPLTFTAEPDVSIDVMGLARTTGVLQGELLEGLSFDDSPAFDTWLGVERQRLVADCRALAYRRSVELLTGGRPEEAARVAVRALESDRLNDELHAVLVAGLTRAGDQAGRTRISPGAPTCIAASWEPGCPRPSPPLPCVLLPSPQPVAPPSGRCSTSPTRPCPRAPWRPGSASCAGPSRASRTPMSSCPAGPGSPWPPRSSTPTAAAAATSPRCCTRHSCTPDAAATPPSAPRRAGSWPSSPSRQDIASRLSTGSARPKAGARPRPRTRGSWAYAA